MKKFILQICEPWNFKAPDGSNEFEVLAIGKTKQLDGKKNTMGLLVKVISSFKFKRKKYDFLILGNRWHGEYMEDFLNGKTKDIDVYINRIINPKVLRDMASNRHDIDYCAIGTLKRHK